MAYHETYRLGDVRQRIVATAAENSRRQSPADAVSDALVSAALNVRSISLDDWKAIIFEAFDATRDAMPSSHANVLATNP